MVTRINNQIKIFADTNELFEFAAKDFFKKAEEAIKKKGEFSVVLSGGNTPKMFFDILASHEYAKALPWEKIKFFFGDERYVPHDSPQSNYHMANEHLFSKLPIKKENIFPIPTHAPNAEVCAKEYDQTLRKAFNIQGDDFPQFDLLYLGLGDDAHTASLMPYTDVVKDYLAHKLPKKDLIAGMFVPKLDMYRITMLPDTINHAVSVVFLATGKGKVEALWNVLEGPENPLEFPAQLINCKHSKNNWFIDKEAAEKIK